MSHLAKSGEQVRTPYKIDTGPIPLDVIAVNQINEPGGCWYRIPSWRVHFDCEALKGVDLRLHRSIASAAVWTLTEATTGFKIFGDIAHDQYIGDEGSMLAEFAAGRMLQLTPEKVAKAIETAKEILAKRPPNPFAPCTTPQKPGELLTREHDKSLRGAAARLALATGFQFDDCALDIQQVCNHVLASHYAASATLPIEITSKMEEAGMAIAKHDLGFGVTRTFVSRVFKAMRAADGDAKVEP